MKKENIHHNEHHEVTKGTMGPNGLKAADCHLEHGLQRALGTVVFFVTS